MVYCTSSKAEIPISKAPVMLAIETLNVVTKETRSLKKDIRYILTTCLIILPLLLISNTFSILDTIPNIGKDRC